ncbi:unnamed protein product [Parnassius mnemosyne]|uniref:Uncharacterized protein n=1 Tax=Parnassius mnemosyne TaxID=213953 RepID=A0AAV1L4A8_9NEOP
METVVVRQFLDFLHDFLHLCQLDNWPSNDTSENELRNAFLMSQHVVKCLDKLHELFIINEFVSTLSDSSISNVLLKKCLEDPPKYILKKIINSSSKIGQMDVGFKVFVELFSEEKLEDYLADFFLEAASKETLLKNLPKEFPKDALMKFKTELILSELSSCNDFKPIIKDMLNDSNENTIDLLLSCLLNQNLKYTVVVKCIVDIFIEIMQSKEIIYKHFWKHLYRLEEKFLIDLCIQHNEIFQLLSKALIDCGRLLKENMSAEYFYIDLTYSELKSVLLKISKNEQLKMEFLELVMNNESELAFWNNILL